jgi:spore coat polysaccharide biosynthesis protein SpsF (cytidylyltransferase family)
VEAREGRGVSAGRTGCVAGIQARMSSSRLPGKVLADLGGKPLIQRVHERVRAAALVDEVFVLTSTDPSDDPLAAELERRGIPFRRGPLEDVLARYLDLCDERDARFVVRVTGDCPFVDPEFVDLQLGALRAFDADIVRARGAVEGTLGGQAAVSARALRLVQASDDPRDREHVGSFFFVRHAAALQEVEIEVEPLFERPGLRLAVDEPADLDFARALWAAADTEGDGLFPLARAIRWLDGHPELRERNAHVRESADNQALRALARRRSGAEPAA